MENTETKPRNFIQEIIDKDLDTKIYDNVHTRFPPEPNGYLHIGHALSICLNFGFGKEFKGKTNLRFDDTNPTKEDIEYVESIMEDVKWLGFEWEGEALFTSDYFDTLYGYAVHLIQKGVAYVDSSSLEEIKEDRGTATEPGKHSKYRDRTVEENIELFERMKNGEFKDGEHILRAKIDMSSPNMNMRDPLMYRIRHAHHHRTGDKWCIYPMYDWAHGQSDSMEGITHSICTLEFENHRPLYNWFIEQLEIHHPRQIEFARLNLNYTIMSKRKLLRLVEEGHVKGWDDPRMPTISGLRRRGFTPLSIRNFTERVGVAKRDGVNDVSLLEFSVREDLNTHAKRVMAVLNPLKVVITNYDENLDEELDALNHPKDETMGSRKIPFSREIYVEQHDFQEVPHRRFHRLTEGQEVRLRYAYIIKCEKVIKDDEGNVIELHCAYDPETKSGSTNSGKKVKGTIHWVSAKHAINAKVRLYDRLFSVENPEEDKEKDFVEFINPESFTVLENAKLEPSLANAEMKDKYQFERNGYFCLDSKDSTKDNIVFNRTVSLRDSWSKLAKK